MSRSPLTKPDLKFLVRNEIQRAMADAHQRRRQTVEIPPHPFGPLYRFQPLPHARVRARGGCTCAQHARLHDPDRIREHRGQCAACRARVQVVDGRQGLLRVIAAVSTDQVLRLLVPEEVECPAGGVADEVWGEATVEGGDARGAFVVEDAAEDGEGGAGEGCRGGGELQSCFDDVEWVDNEGADQAGGEAGDGLDARGGEVDWCPMAREGGGGCCGGHWMRRGRGGSRGRDSGCMSRFPCRGSSWRLLSRRDHCGEWVG